MDPIQSFIPPNIGEDEGILHRLGWAVVRQWPHLPEDVRKRLQEQATFVEGPPTSQLNEQIGAFIRKHQGKR